MPQIKALYDLSSVVTTGSWVIKIVGNLKDDPAITNMIVSDIRPGCGDNFSQIEIWKFRPTATNFFPPDFFTTGVETLGCGLTLSEGQEGVGIVDDALFAVVRTNQQVFDKLVAPQARKIGAFHPYLDTVSHWRISLSMIDGKSELLIFTLHVDEDSGKKSSTKEVSEDDFLYPSKKTSFSSYFSKEKNIEDLESRLHKYYSDTEKIQEPQAHLRALEISKYTLGEVYLGKLPSQLPPQVYREIRERRDAVKSFLMDRKKRYYNKVQATIRAMKEKMSMKEKYRKMQKDSALEEQYELAQTAILSPYSTTLHLSIAYTKD